MSWLLAFSGDEAGLLPLLEQLRGGMLPFDAEALLARLRFQQKRMPEATQALERAFALLKPKAVLLVGAASSKFILGTDEGIMKLRGQWREWRLAEGAVSAPALPTLHPAYLLRNPAAKQQAWRDLLSFRQKLMEMGLADAPPGR